MTGSLENPVYRKHVARSATEVAKRYSKVLGKLLFDLPPYVFVHFRQGLWIAVNYTYKITDIPVAECAEVLSGGIRSAD